MPQGSILGPVLFLLFVTDMPLHVHKSTMDIYADDSTLSSRSNWKTISSLTQTLADDLAEIERWTRGNKLYINTLNTKALLVTGKRLRRRTDQDSGKLEVVTKPLKLSKSQVIHCIFLGLIIDENLTYQVHVSELFNNLSKRLGVLRHISPYLKVLEEKSENHLL